MARTLEEIIVSHLGKQQWHAISLAFQVEQAELKVRELESALKMAREVADGARASEPVEVRNVG